VTSALLNLAAASHLPSQLVELRLLADPLHQTAFQHFFDVVVHVISALLHLAAASRLLSQFVELH
jgi:hypothetical protein